jgi:hypothetical protein
MKKCRNLFILRQRKNQILKFKKIYLDDYFRNDKDEDYFKNSEIVENSLSQINKNSFILIRNWNIYLININS